MIVEPWIDAKDRPVPNKGTAQLLKFNKAEVPDIGAIISKCDFLSSFEIERARKFRYDKDRNTFIISRSLLRFILSPILQEPAKHIDISMTELGKPYLSRHPDIRFNISHSSNLILVGLGNDELGVDVEFYNHNINYKDLATSVFSDSEIEQLELLKNQNVQRGFYNIWTKKESFIKALGKGLQIPLSDFSVRAFDEGFLNLLEIKWDKEAVNKWQIFNLEINRDYGAAVCCHPTVEKLKLFDITRWFENTL